MFRCSETMRWCCRYTDSGEEVQWWYVGKRLAFSAAMRAALGDALSKQDLDELFPPANAMNAGVFAVVRPPPTRS